MNNNLKIFSFPILLTLLSIVSCKVGEITPSASVDARIITLVTANDTLFGLGLYAYTTGEFYSVSAHPLGTDSSFYELEPFNNSTYDYFYETPLYKMSEQIPETGEYVFDIEFEDSEFGTLSDYLTDSYIMPPFLTTCEYNTDIDQIVVRWAEIVDDNSLMFKVYNQNRELLYSSSMIDKSAAVYTLAYNENTWEIEEPPTNGEKLFLHVIMYSFEPLTRGPFETQSAAILEKTITWGE